MNEPRVVLRQRRDLGQIIEAALRLYGQNFSGLFRIAAIVIPLAIAVGIFQAKVKSDAIGIPLVGALGVGQAAVNLLAGAALMAATTDIEAGRPPDATRAYDVATERFLTLVAAILRVAFHVVLYFVTIIGIPWGIQRAVRWVFVEQAVVLDGAGAKGSLSRSADVVLGSWWRTLGIVLLISLMAAVPGGIAGGLFSIAPIAVSATATAAVNAVMLPFVVLATTLLYFDLQARKEPAPVIDKEAS